MINFYILAFSVYFCILLLIGWFSHHKQTSNADYLAGNRSLNYWLTAFSAHASDMSAWLFMGLPMAVFVNGIGGSWIAIGLLTGMLLTWTLVATRLRIATEQHKTYTLPTYFESRYNDKTGVIRIVAACLLLFYLTHYLSAGLTAMGMLIESVFQIDYYIGLTIATMVVVAYSVFGGFVTIAWTDLFQALFLISAIILVPILTYFSLDNPATAFENFALAHEGYFDLIGDQSTTSILSAIFLALAWGLGYFGMPHIITKFMGINDPKELKKSMILGMSWQLLALGASIAVGVIGAVYFQDSLVNPELVFVELVKILFHPFIAGFILCGVLAANLSTMDSQLLVCASVIGEDFYKKFAGKKLPATQFVTASRLGLIGIAATALLIAFYKNETLIESVLYAWAGLGSSFGPLVLMSLYYTKGTKYGALTGMIAGGLISAIWPSINPYFTAYQIPAMVPGFFSNLFCFYLVSILTSKSKNH